MFGTIIVVCVCASVAYLCYGRRNALLVNHLVPVLPGRLPVLGHIYRLFNVAELYELVKNCARFTNENGGVSVFFLGLMPVYTVSDPEDVQTVLQKCLDKPVVYDLIDPLVGKILVSAKVPVWKRSRRLTDLGFKQNVLDGYLALFKTEADRLVESLSELAEKGDVDVTEKITRSFFETTCRTTLGNQEGGEDLVNDKYVEAVDTFFETILIKSCRPWYMLEPIFTLSSYKKKYDEAKKKYFGLTKEMFHLRKKQHLQRLKNNTNWNTEGKGFRSFLDILIENCVTETGASFTDVELRNIVDNVLMASFDTTIYQMILVLVCIGSRPDLQDKIHQQITEVLGEDGDVTKDNLAKLVYLEAAIKESIRLYPIASVVGRRTTAAVELRDFTLPAGCNIIVHVWGTNVNPKYWGSDSEEYKPERWFSDSLPDHPAAFTSFCPGRRGCPGKMYTLMYFKATLVPIIRRYKLSANLLNLKLTTNVLIKPKSGHHISIRRR